MRALRWWIAGYVVMLAAVLLVIYAARDQVLHGPATDESMADWQAWRQDVARQQTRPGPVERRVPKSMEPPALVLMRDHFTVSVVAALVFSTALYWTFAWFINGMLR